MSFVDAFRNRWGEKGNFISFSKEVRYEPVERRGIPL
jgi:hypothetical protein